MQRLSVEANSTLRRIREFTVREELNMGDDLDSGTLPTTVPDLLRRVLQKFGKSSPGERNGKSACVLWEDRGVEIIIIL